jgi:multidrug efflux pump subunit AcrA (membrane-fusion protein)
MTNSLPSSGLYAHPATKLRSMLCVLALTMLAASSACQSGGSSSVTDARGIIVVNAPAAGVVRRVLVSEGVSVNEGASIVEIAVQDQTPLITPSPGESAESRAARNFKAADAEIEAARAEAVRHQAEVERLTPLVASGQASQGDLDGERALFEHAQQRLQQAQSAKRNAETGLLAARQPGQNQAGASTLPPREQIISARASSAGTVSVISAHVGDHVTAGQPLATLRANQP